MWILPPTQSMYSPSIFFFHLEKSDHPKGMAMEKTLSRLSSASSLQPIEAEVQRLFSVSWKRPTGARRHTPPPAHASISCFWWEGQHFTWVTTIFKWLFLPFFSQIHEKWIYRKHELVAWDWPLRWPIHDCSSLQVNTRRTSPSITIKWDLRTVSACISLAAGPCFKV